MSFTPSRVSAAVWPWSTPKLEQTAHKPSPGKLMVQAAFGYAIAYGLHLAGGHWSLHFLSRAAWVAAGATTLLFILGFAAPTVHAHIFKAVLRFVNAIGTLLTDVLLPFVYFTVFLIVGLFRRIIGVDSLSLRYPPPAGSLWAARRPVADKSAYERQF